MLSLRIFSMVLLASVFGACGEDSRPPVIDIDPPPDALGLDYHACWSGMHDIIAYAHGKYTPDSPDTSAIYLVNPDGSDRRLFLQVSFVNGLDWSPDGQWLLANVGSQLWKISYPDGIVDTLLTNSEYHYPSWSPDGLEICYSGLSLPDGGVYIYNLTSASSRRIIQFGYAADWVYPDSIIYLNFDYALPIGALCMADSSGNSTRIIYDPEGQFVWSAFLPKMHITTRRVIFQGVRPGEIPSIWRLDDGNSVPTRMMPKAGYPAFSPDGDKVVFTRRGRPYANLWIINWDGTGLTELTESLFE